MSCKKIIEIDSPRDSITTESTFKDDAGAISAVTGIYSNMVSGNNSSSINFFNSAITILASLSSDELNTFSTDPDMLQFLNNNLSPDNNYIYSNLWSQAFSNLYQVNTCIEALGKSNSLTPSIKNQLEGECKFLRSFINFYLINLYGDIPLVLTSQWKQTSSLSRIATDQVYQQIVADLKDAQNLLKNDYSFSNSDRARPNKWAATALLARVYLYSANWSNAEIQASSVINSSLFDTVSINEVFLKNNKESIWQLMPVNIYPAYNGTMEGYQFTSGSSANPNYFLINDFLTAFEPNDLRFTNWIGTTSFAGTTYYYPNKYKIGASQSGSTIIEAYDILRLGEQYLIRAEAGAKQDKLSNAIEDINLIRNRAGLPALSQSLSQSQILSAIEQERRVELFAEWGHRWFDLKRTNRANSVLGSLKPNLWQPTDHLWPIPNLELQRNPHLTQNTGY